jgi:hypothetical protein
MRARRVVLLLVVVLAFYLFLVGERGFVLVRDGRPALVLLGVGVLVLPAIGAWIVVMELRFGRAVEHLARELETRGALPLDERAYLPSGRPDRAAADEVFARRRAEVEDAPQDWARWYRLAVAYGDAGDTARGRRAMRRAVALHRTGAR